MWRDGETRTIGLGQKGALPECLLVVVFSVVECKTEGPKREHTSASCLQTSLFEIFLRGVCSWLASFLRKGRVGCVSLGKASVV